MNQTLREGVFLVALVTAVLVTKSCGDDRPYVPGRQAVLLTNAPTVERSFLVTEVKRVEIARDTNMWSSTMIIDNVPRFSTERAPMCKVVMHNISTNTVDCWGGLYVETYSKIELLDPKGGQVQRTTAGMQIGTRIDDKQIRQMVKDRRRRLSLHKSRTDGFDPIRPGEDLYLDLSLPVLFDLTQAGGYTLKVQTCMIQRLGKPHYDPPLKITWLPEVTTTFNLELNESQSRSVRSADGNARMGHQPSRGIWCR